MHVENVSNVNQYVGLEQFQYPKDKRKSKALSVYTKLL